VGVPTFARPHRRPDGGGALEHMQYKGRIRLPRLEFSGEPVVLDHW
jgi:hypothetical protein